MIFFGFRKANKFENYLLINFLRSGKTKKWPRRKKKLENRIAFFHNLEKSARIFSREGKQVGWVLQSATPENKNQLA